MTSDFGQEPELRRLFNSFQLMIFVFLGSLITIHLAVLEVVQLMRVQTCREMIRQFNKHGIKWQTVDLPTGMNFHVWGPCSVRHNDLFSLMRSDINELVRVAQALVSLVQYFSQCLHLSVLLCHYITDGMISEIDSFTLILMPIA